MSAGSSAASNAFRSLLIVPLRSAANGAAVSGFIEAVNATTADAVDNNSSSARTHRAGFSADDETALSLVASLLSSALERASMMAQAVLIQRRADALRDVVDLTNAPLPSEAHSAVSVPHAPSALSSTDVADIGEQAANGTSGTVSILSEIVKQSAPLQNMAIGSPTLSRDESALDPCAQRILRAAVSLVPCESVRLFALDSSAAQFVSAQSLPTTAGAPSTLVLTVPIGHGYLGACADAANAGAAATSGGGSSGHGALLVAHPARADSDWRCTVSVAEEVAHRNLLFAPILDADGRVIAVLRAANRVDASAVSSVSASASTADATSASAVCAAEFTRDDADVLSAIAASAGVTLQRAAAQRNDEALRRQTDALMHINALVAGSGGGVDHAAPSRNSPTTSAASSSSTSQSSSHSSLFSSSSSSSAEHAVLSRVIDAAYALIPAESISLFLIPEALTSSSSLSPTGTVSNTARTTPPLHSPAGGRSQPLLSAPSVSASNLGLPGIKLVVHSPGGAATEAGSSLSSSSSSSRHHRHASTPAVNVAQTSQRQPQPQPSAAIAGQSSLELGGLSSPPNRPSQPQPREMVCIVSRVAHLQGFRVSTSLGGSASAGLLAHTVFTRRSVSAPFGSDALARLEPSFVECALAASSSSSSSSSLSSLASAPRALRSALIVPVLDAADGRCLAVLVAVNRTATDPLSSSSSSLSSSSSFGDRDRTLAESVAASVATVLRRAVLQVRVADYRCCFFAISCVCTLSLHRCE